MTSYVANILSTYARSTDAECASGGDWYRTAHALASVLSPNDVWRAAGVIACFSARTPWGRNRALAIQAFETGQATGHIGMFCGLAQRILDGEPAMEVLKGDKTRAFTAAIATAGNSDIATIDGHAYDIADGKVWGKNRPGINKTVYRAMAEAYADAAVITAMPVCEIQAITWVTHRRILGINWRDK